MIPAAKPQIGDEERAAVDRVLQSGMLAQGPEVAAFEQEFSQLVDGRHSVALNSGTSALHLAFLAAGVGPGDEIIVPSFSFAATANAVALTGATPVFADIELDTFNLDPAAAEAAITPRTKGIMPVHLYGHPADLVALKEIADRHGILLFEDAAQARGRERRRHPGRRLGHRIVLVLPDEEHDLRRGRDGHHRLRRGGAQHPGAAQPGHGAPLRERGRRLQQPHDRPARGDRPRAAEEARRAGRRTGSATRRS